MIWGQKSFIREKNGSHDPPPYTGTRAVPESAIKDLQCSSNLNLSSRINTITNKAKNSLRFIRRNVRTNNLKRLHTEHKLCTPQVEYCSTIWQKHLTHRIEMVPRSVTRYVQNDCHYTRVIQLVPWTTGTSHFWQGKLVPSSFAKLTNVDSSPFFEVTHLSPIIRWTIESILSLYANCYNYKFDLIN